jgi:hypothetical protein
MCVSVIDLTCLVYTHLAYLDPTMHELSALTRHLSGCSCLDQIHPVATRRGKLFVNRLAGAHNRIYLETFLTGVDTRSVKIPTWPQYRHQSCAIRVRPTFLSVCRVMLIQKRRKKIEIRRRASAERSARTRVSARFPGLVEQLLCASSKGSFGLARVKQAAGTTLHVIWPQ